MNAATDSDARVRSSRALRIRRRMEALKPHLDTFYDRWNRREYIDPDPLMFVHRYADPADKEIVGLLASSLAFGNVKQILCSVEWVLARMPEPAAWLDASDEPRMRATFQGFRHRYVGEHELCALLAGVRHVRARYGTLGAAYATALRESGGSVDGLAQFVRRITDGVDNYLLPCPSRGSACKRLHLFLRWMVRRDAVDPGCWPDVSTSQLTIPLDTHMHRIARRLGLTMRRSADATTAREITDAFRIIVPEDPVRYDFALTRMGIRSDTNADCFWADCARLV